MAMAHLRRLTQNGRYIALGMLFAVIYTVLNRTYYNSQDRTQLQLVQNAFAQDRSVITDTNSNLTQDNSVMKLNNKVRQTNALVTSHLKDIKKRKDLSNKNWMFGDYQVSDNLNTMQSGYRRKERIDNLLTMEHIRRVSEEITNTHNGSTIPFLPNYRNPCWFEAIDTHKGLYKQNQLVLSAQAKIPFANTLNDNARVYESRVKEGQGWRLRCLPYFYIIGFAKCGTTDLFMRLQDHPHVTNGLKKEIHWWSEARFGTFWRTKTNKVPLRDYVDFFDVAAEHMRVHCVQDTGNGTEYHPCVASEGSITTVYSNPIHTKDAHGHPVPPGPRDMVPAFIKHLVPRAKIIMMLRNPVDRLYSSYVYFGSKTKISNKDFHGRVVKGVRLMRECIQARGTRQCVYDLELKKQTQRAACIEARGSHQCVNDLELKKQTQVALGEGMYSVYLQDWYSVYPREQIRAIKMEEYSQHKAEVLQDTVRFLELDPYPEKLLSSITEKAVENSVKKYYDKKGGILPETTKVLQDFYKPYVDQLVDMMNEEKWRWF